MTYNYSQTCKSIFVIILLLCFLSVSLPVIAHDKPSNLTLIGLSHVNPDEIGDTFDKEKVEELVKKLFAQLNKNSDASIDSSEFSTWDTKIKALNSTTANLFKNITAQHIFEATDIDANAKLTVNEVRALYYFDFISKDADQNEVLDETEISQTPIILRLVSKDCKSINTMYNGMLMGGFCGK
jgi:Ca2+-binding EF-hand superfamily protein